ncbi:MAG: hypothetical protein AB8B58_17650 [Roseobacter sp.]
MPPDAQIEGRVLRSMAEQLYPPIDLERHPRHQRGSDAYAALVAQCRNDLGETGMFNLPGS